MALWVRSNFSVSCDNGTLENELDRIVDEAILYGITKEKCVADYVALTWHVGENLPNTGDDVRLILESSDIEQQEKVEIIWALGRTLHRRSRNMISH
jgi:hypothetical protein